MIIILYENLWMSELCLSLSVLYFVHIICFACELSFSYNMQGLSFIYPILYLASLFLNSFFYNYLSSTSPNLLIHFIIFHHAHFTHSISNPFDHHI